MAKKDLKPLNTDEDPKHPRIIVPFQLALEDALKNPPPEAPATVTKAKKKAEKKPAKVKAPSKQVTKAADKRKKPVVLASDGSQGESDEEAASDVSPSEKRARVPSSSEVGPSKVPSGDDGRGLV